jgi:hypothetical protein
MEGMTRPPAVVLPESAMVPDRNLIVPAPNRFTHALTRATPYYFAGTRHATSPDGELAAGTTVVLLVDDGDGRCRVVDGQGLYVEIACDCLQTLPPSPIGPPGNQLGS